MKGALAVFLSSVLRRVPLAFGTGRLANSALLRFFASGDGVVRAKTKEGHQLLVRINDTVGRTIFYFGDADRRISWVLKRLLDEGHVFVDIGSNVGAVTVLGASLVGPEGVVHAFEPQVDLAELSRQSLVLNGFSWANVHPVALSDRDGEAVLNLVASSSAYASLEFHGDSPSSVAVPVHHSGRYLQQILGARQIRLLKIDVEGHEGAVIRGAKEFFEVCPPCAVLFEFPYWHHRFWDDELVNILSELDFEFFGLVHHSVRVRLEEITPGQEPLRQVRDAVAIHRGACHGEILRKLSI
jgi:FkbM family methyltransferase